MEIVVRSNRNVRRSGGELFASASFFKGHGLGNDYLVFGPGEDWRVTPEAVRRICHRWKGVGADGLVVELPPRGSLRMLRMFNPDGGEFERSGNGLRIFAASLQRSDRSLESPFEVEVGGGRVAITVYDRSPEGVYDVSVDMGTASFRADDVGLRPEHLDSAGRVSLGEEDSVDLVAVSMGNPHCVVFDREMSPESLRRLGTALSGHPLFSRGTNVQLATPLGPNRVRALVWERGVGRTASSGTSACAVAAAAVKTGRVAAGNIAVEMEGGDFLVKVTASFEITLQGPVQEICSGSLSPGFLESLS